MARRNREGEKAARELNVFSGFVEFAALEGLRVRQGSAVSRRPPEPDVRCELEGGGHVAFELVEIIDSGLAENISVSIRKNIPADGVWVGDTTLERIRGKLEAKTYETPHPMELVAWANPFITPPSVWCPTYQATLKALHGLSPFRRIWVVNLGGPDHERGVWFVNPPLIGAVDEGARRVAAEEEASIATGDRNGRDCPHCGGALRGADGLAGLTQDVDGVFVKCRRCANRVDLENIPTPAGSPGAFRVAPKQRKSGA